MALGGVTLPRGARLALAVLTGRGYHVLTSKGCAIYSNVLPKGSASQLLAMPKITKLSKPMQWAPSQIFTPAYIRKNMGVTPIIGLVTIWAVGISSFTIYAIRTRDAEYTRESRKQFECVETLRNPKQTKLIRSQQEWNPLPELADLYDEIHKAEAEAAKSQGGA